MLREHGRGYLGDAGMMFWMAELSHHPILPFHFWLGEIQYALAVGKEN